MVQHLSVRVPWHDHGWDGTVCQDPCGNNACLRLKNISENRDDAKELEICGQCMQDYSDELSCITEGAAFMSDEDLVYTTVHPYKKSNPKTHGHFQETTIVYPAYSLPARPFAWLMKDEKNIERLVEQYGVNYDERIEPVLPFSTSWIQEANNHKAIFDYFYRDIVPERSLCIAYAKQVPFVEDTRRVVIGMGHVKDIVEAKEHNHTDEKPLRSMTWETMIKHSIRADHKDGFIIPYQEMMEYANEHPEFDMESITVFAPDDAFAEFSYASEHVTHDAVIDVLLSCYSAFKIINECLDEDYSNVISWINDRLAEVWKDRGGFPGLGAMFTAIGMPLGVVVAKDFFNAIDEDDDVWECVERLFDKPSEYLSEDMAVHITEIVKKTWKNLGADRKALFKLLSRFSINVDQAKVLYFENERVKHHIECTDKEIIENPYILYERTRLKIDDLFISVRKVDRAIFPVVSIQEKYPIEEPSKLDSDNDERRIRALAISVLEASSLNGNTILPCNMLVDKIHDVVLEPECTVTIDILSAIEKFIASEILKREMKDGTEYYKLVRINKFDEVIEKRINKRLKASRLEINADWRKLLDEKFDQGKKRDLDEKEMKAREEKAAALKELAESRISVLVGDAGTGKTTVLSVLCEHPDIKSKGVLLLAPTGKATVRLLESMGKSGGDYTAKNVAQFLCSRDIGGFIWEDMRYELPKTKSKLSYGTVIIDEASMLTEEMFGALLEALGKVPRIIFVGDPNQLPPIGAGKPFVDLVYRLNKDIEDDNSLFPRVAASYGELTINRRQQSEEIRSDVLLSQLFTKKGDADEDLMSEIIKGESEEIQFIKWKDKIDLEEKLLEVVAKETGMKDVDDLNGFNASLGATFSGNYAYFNRGCAEYADNWQILAPVRNMPHGVMNINRLFHIKYRENFIELSSNWGRYKKIANKLGPEGIVYGDKVINVENHSKEAWPNENGGRDYIANGEIGIACDDFKNGRKDNYLHVEFSTQKGVVYSFDGRNDFNDERGTARLELAYGLTVHKSQGSQFNKVILVLADPCALISREMLYTALTRQLDKIIILYNNEPFEMLKYANDTRSDIARRLTDLFADVFSDSETKRDVRFVQKDGTFYDEKLIHCTVRGEMVRSKSEVIIANALHYNDLDYEYEAVLELEGKICRPDFMIEDGDTGDVWYWEHCGMMSDPGYKKRWENKKAFYEKNGIKEGKNLIVTYDDKKGGLDSAKIDEMIKDIFDL